MLLAVANCSGRGTSRGARLACEAVVSREHRDSRLTSFDALCQELWLLIQERGMMVSLPYPQPCSPRPRKRGTLHGSRVMLTRMGRLRTMADKTTRQASMGLMRLTGHMSRDGFLHSISLITRQTGPSARLPVCPEVGPGPRKGPERDGCFSRRFCSANFFRISRTTSVPPLFSGAGGQ